MAEQDRHQTAAEASHKVLHHGAQRMRVDASIRRLSSGIRLYLGEIKKMGARLPSAASKAEYITVKGLKVVKYSSAAAFSLGARTSAKKAAASALNGRRGGRPRKSSAATTIRRK